MPPSMESTASSGSSEPRRHPPRAVPPILAHSSRRTRTPPQARHTAVFVKAALRSFTRSSGKATAASLSQSSSASTTPPHEDMSERVEKLDLTRGAPKPDGSAAPREHSAPVSRRASMSKSDDEPHVPHYQNAEQINQDSPLPRVLRSAKAVSCAATSSRCRAGIGHADSLCG